MLRRVIKNVRSKSFLNIFFVKLLHFSHMLDTVRTHTTIWPWCAPLVAPNRGSATWGHACGAIGFPQHLLVGLGHQQLPEEPAVRACPQLPQWPHTAIWPWRAPLVAPSRVSATWGRPLGATGSPQHPLLGGNHPQWPGDPTTPLCPTAPLVAATHCHLALVHPTSGS